MRSATIQTNAGKTIALSADALERVLREACARTDDIWIAETGTRHPALAILSSGTACVVHFFPTGDHPGFLAITGDPVPTSDAGAFTAGGQPAEPPPEALLPIDVAIAAAPAFFATGDRPSDLTWREL